jgi:HK97 family phage portal protein
MPVTEQTALGISSLWCGIRVIAETVGSLPPILYGTNGQVKEARNHPLYPLLKSEPNPESTRPVVWECAVAMGILYGNFFMEIVRDGSGRPVALWNLHPHNVIVARDTETGKLVYRVQNSATGGPPGYPGKSTVLQSEDVIHVPMAITPDGSVGYRLLVMARDVLGFALATQRYGCSLFRNLGVPGGVIELPQGMKLNETAAENLRKSFRAETSGENVGSLLILEQGHKYTPQAQADNKQLQYTEILNFYVYEVARLLNIPPFKLHSLDSATWNSATQQQEAFLSTTLRPIIIKIEAELEKKLLMPSEKGKYKIEFDTHDLLRADKPTRYAAYALGLQNQPFLTVDEVRAEESLPPMKPQDTDQGDDKTQPTEEVDAGAGPVQDTALSGIQITALLGITDKVVDKTYPPEAAIEIILASFPAMPPEKVREFVEALAAAPAPEPEPAPAPPASEPDGDESDDQEDKTDEQQ